MQTPNRAGLLAASLVLAAWAFGPAALAQDAAKDGAKNPVVALVDGQARSRIQSEKARLAAAQAAVLAEEDPP